MRRRRQPLQVSTFPFLAVLLCTMGSLILLLLVIDRRAKIVAAAKARKTAIRKIEEDEREAAARQEEWERRRRALHALLLEQDQATLAQVQDLRNQIASADTEMQQSQVRNRGLHDQLGTEKIRLAQGEKELAARRAGVAQTAGETKASQAELARLIAELEKMEQTLALLKAARQRDQRTYSVVPYKGKQGDNRRPLYVECTATSVIFHPDRLALPVNGLTTPDIRGEVERRIARHKTGTNALKKDELPYLLLLVRPDGITTYYAALSALRGVEFDYGYEFIDAAWVLDFPDSDDKPGTQPWMTADKTSTTSSPTASSVKTPGSGTSVAGLPPNRSVPAVGSPVAGGSAGGNAGQPRGVTNVGQDSNPDRLRQDWNPDPRGGSNTGRPHGGTSGTATDKQPPSNTAGATNGDKAPDAPPAPPFGQGQAPAGSSTRTEPPSSAEAKDKQAGSEPPRTGGKGNPPCENEPAAASPRDPLAPLPGSGVTQGKPNPPAPAKPIRLYGNRDWTLFIECTADAVVIYPTRQRLEMASLSAGSNGDNPLLQVVQQMIARRQASVRPDEPPYRPQVRFLVRPDGLRSYYTAYPLLSSLRIPMTRLNLEPDEEVKTGGF